MSEALALTGMAGVGLGAIAMEAARWWRTDHHTGRLDLPAILVPGASVALVLVRFVAGAVSTLGSPIVSAVALTSFDSSLSLLPQEAIISSRSFAAARIASSSAFRLRFCAGM